MFPRGGVIIVQVFSYRIVDKACGAPDIVLVAVVTCDFRLLKCKHNLVRDIHCKTVDPCSCQFRAVRE